MTGQVEVRVFKHTNEKDPAANLSQEAAFERLVDDIQRRCRDLFDRDGCVQPIVFVVATRDAETGETLDPPQLAVANAVEFMDDSRGKDQFSRFMGWLAEKTRAIGIVFVSESWALIGHEAAKDYDFEKGETIEKHPKRTEVIVVSSDYVKWKNERLAHARITRDAAGKGTGSPFETLDLAATMEGRFAGMLHKERFS